MGPCPFGRYFAQIKGVHSRILRRIKVFLHNNGQKNVFVAEYFLLALKRYTVVFKEVTEVFGRVTLRVDLFVTCAVGGRSIRPLQFFVDFKLKSD